MRSRDQVRLRTLRMALTSITNEEVAAERAEGEVLAGYLPAQLGDDELAELVAAAIAETGATGMKSMGQVMKTLTPRVAGRADGARVAAEVRRRLGAG